MITPPNPLYIPLAILALWFIDIQLMKRNEMKNLDNSVIEFKKAVYNRIVSRSGSNNAAQMEIDAIDVSELDDLDLEDPKEYADQLMLCWTE